MPRRGNDQAKRLDAAINDLDFRWPPLALADAHDAATSRLLEDPRLESAAQWPRRLAALMRTLLRERFIDDADATTRQEVLRELSVLAATLMHLHVRKGRAGITLLNERRTRTRYPTYPTSPRLGAAVAEHIVTALSEAAPDRRTPYRVIDPTMEGGPILLELAFRAQLERKQRSRFAGLALTGVDQNPASAPIVGALLDAWSSTLSARSCAMRHELKCADAFATLEGSPAFDAVANNPPWGARTDGAHEAQDWDAWRDDPFVHYRDPYIALTALSLRKLKPGGPFAFILPFQILSAASAARLRSELADNCTLGHIVALPRSAFPRATVKTVMMLGRARVRGEQTRAVHVVAYPMTRRIEEKSTPRAGETDTLALTQCGREPWTQALNLEPPFRAPPSSLPLGDIAHIALGIEPYRIGRGVPVQTKVTLKSRPFTFDAPTPGASPVLRSANLKRWRADGPSEYVRIGRWLAVSGRHVETAQSARVFVRQICARDGSLVAAPAPRGLIARAGVFTIIGAKISPLGLTALLNSAATARYVKSACPGFHKESFGRITGGDLRRLPVPAVLLENDTQRGALALRRKLKALVTEARALESRGRSTRAQDKAIDALIDRAFISSPKPTAKA